MKINRLFTHSGAFHADEVMAIAIIKMIATVMTILRVRELPQDFEVGSDIAVDVGSKQDPAKGMFDHHQKGGSEDNFAATGKVWAFFGTALCQSHQVADRVYLTLLGSIDRADIGISDWTPVREEWRHLGASAFIASMNPPFGCSKEESDAAFEAAVTACSFALKGAIENAKTFCRMQDVIAKAEQPFKEVIILSEGGPWQEHVVGNSNYDQILYVIFPSDRGGFQLQCVPPQAGSFGQRKPLPVEWAGLRGQELADVVGSDFEIGSSLFCHPGRFIAGAMNLQDTIWLAEFAVESSDMPLAFP